MAGRFPRGLDGVLLPVERPGDALVTFAALRPPVSVRYDPLVLTVVV